MAVKDVKKDKSTIISKEDLLAYIEGESDFGFEVSVLRVLRDEKFVCEHGGTYPDPVTEKFRQFDIRARFEYERKRYLLSIECKNIKNTSPLLVHSVERHREESYHDLATSFWHLDKSNIKVTRVKGLSSLYPKNGFVAKSVDQVSYKGDGKFNSSDSETYEKLEQALASAHDLLWLAHTPTKSQEARLSTCVIPILVIPDERLWEVRYDIDGRIIQEPQPISHVSYFKGKDWFSPTALETHSISHMEIVTFSGLKPFIKDFLFAQFNSWE